MRTFAYIVATIAFPPFGLALLIRWAFRKPKP